MMYANSGWMVFFGVMAIMAIITILAFRAFYVLGFYDGAKNTPTQTKKMERKITSMDVMKMLNNSNDSKSEKTKAGKLKFLKNNFFDVHK